MSTDLLERLQREAADKNRQVPEKLLLTGREQIVAPGDRRSHRLLMQWQVSPTAGKQWERMPETHLQRRWRKHLDPRGGQFNGQRQTIETAADIDDCRPVLLGEREIRFDALGPQHKKSDRVGTIQVLQRWIAWYLHDLERSDWILVLAGDLQAGTAGRQNRERGATRQEIRHNGRSCDNLLEIIEQQQQLMVEKSRLDDLAQLNPGGFAYPEHTCDGRKHQWWITNRCQRYEECAVTKV